MKTELKKNKIKNVKFLVNKLSEKTDVSSFPKYIFFLGAGCSVSSSIPSGKQLTEILKRVCYLRENKIYDINLTHGLIRFNEDFTKFYETSKSTKVDFSLYVKYLENIFKEKIENQRSYFIENLPVQIKRQIYKIDKTWGKIKGLLLNDLEYGYWFEKYSSNPKERQKLIEDIIANVTPSSGYLILANLIRHGIIHTVLTTNFDDLLNDSLLKFCDIKSRIYAHNEIADYLIFDKKTPNIIKLHGDFLYEDIRNILSETQSLGDKLSKNVKELFDLHGLIVIGYSGSDYSVMQELEKAKALGHSFPLIWCDIKKENLNWRTIHLINNTTESYFVQIPSFDELVTKILSKYKIPIQSLIDSNKNHQQLFNRKLKDFKVNTVQKTSLLIPSEKRHLERGVKIIEVLEKASEISDPNERIKLYNDAIKLERTNHEHYLFKGVACMDKARRYNAPQYYKIAIKCFSQSIKLNPNDYRCYYYKGCTELLNKQYKQSLKSFTDSIELNNSFALCFNNRGLSKMRMKQYDEAIKDFNSAISIDLNDADFYNNIAVTYRHKKEYSKGISAIKKALQIDQDFSFLYGTLAELYAGLNDTENFYTALEKALSMNYPVFEFLDEVGEYNKFLDKKRFKDLMQKYKMEYYLR